MNAHATLCADPAPHDVDPVREAVERARALARRQLAVLERLAEAGIEVALAVEREAKAKSPDAPSAPVRAPEARPVGAAPDASEDPGAAAMSAPSDPSDPPEAGRARTLQGLAMAYARAARAVRMVVLLQSKVVRDLESAERLAAFDAPAEASRRRAARHAASEARKLSLERIIVRVAEGQSADQEALLALAVDAAERLDNEDIYGDVLTRPMGEIVARICRDLGLDPDWSRLAQEAWAEAEIAAAPPGSPFAGLAGVGDLPFSRAARANPPGPAGPVAPCPAAGDSS